MLEKTIIAIVISVIVMVLAAFSPWITEDFAEDRAIASFQDSQKGIEDGCGFNCEGCGAVQSENVMFGYKVWLEYACGMAEEDRKEDHQTKEFFVSFLGTVHSYSGK